MKISLLIKVRVREEQEELTGNRVDKGSFFRIKIIVNNIFFLTIFAISL